MDPSSHHLEHVFGEICRAISVNDVHGARVLIQQCEPSALACVDEDGNNLLHVAARHGARKVVKELLRRAEHCDPYAATYEGKNVVQVARENNHEEVVEYLVKKLPGFAEDRAGKVQGQQEEEEEREEHGEEGKHGEINEDGEGHDSLPLCHETWHKDSFLLDSPRLDETFLSAESGSQEMVFEQPAFLTENFLLLDSPQDKILLTSPSENEDEEAKAEAIEAETTSQYFDACMNKLVSLQDNRQKRSFILLADDHFHQLHRDFDNNKAAKTATRDRTSVRNLTRDDNGVIFDKQDKKVVISRSMLEFMEESKYEMKNSISTRLSGVESTVHHDCRFGWMPCRPIYLLSPFSPPSSHSLHMLRFEISESLLLHRPTLQTRWARRSSSQVAPGLLPMLSDEDGDVRKVEQQSDMFAGNSET
eukprot:763520-Hanusia_phi.AAC.2